MCGAILSLRMVAMDGTTVNARDFKGAIYESRERTEALGSHESELEHSESRE